MTKSRSAAEDVHQLKQKDNMRREESSKGSRNPEWQIAGRAAQLLLQSKPQRAAYYGC